MVSPDSERIYSIENSDRISQLPEPMILNILSRLPLEDSARASILSKTWKSFCSVYPIFYFDHNLFALQSLVSAKEGDGMPDINQIRDMFMDGVDYQLSRATQLDSPIRKLTLTVAINDSMYFYRVDKWMELVRQINVEDLCITVQTTDFMSEDDIYKSSLVYEFPLSVLSSKGLSTAFIRGCKFGCGTFIGDPINKYISLQRLCLSHVFMDEDMLENLIKCCQGIETLVLDNSFVEIKFLILSKFPKLKKAFIRLKARNRAIVDFKTLILNASNVLLILHFLSALLLLLVLESCAYHGIAAVPGYSLTCLKTLPLHFHFWKTEYFICLVHIDCPSLTLLRCDTNHLSELYVDCPKLREFSYCGTAIPDRVFCSSMANLEKSHCSIIMYEAYDTLWLVKLRAFLILVMGNATHVELTFTLPMVTFEPEQVEAIEVSSRYNVHLTRVLYDDNMQDIAALMDGLLWIIRPTTLTVSCEAYYLVKYLCENLYKKQEDSICNEQLTRPCWMHQLEDFHVNCPLGVPVKMKNLAAFPEQCRTLVAKQICFKFHWCFN